MTTTCPVCGQKNRAGRKFCAECGRALASLGCPSCGATNEAGEKFCGDCGTSLTATTASPPVVAAGGERKHITVLFADVAGSMDLQEQLDAEVWAQIMGRFVAILVEGIRKFGGTIDKFTGDGIMALFGAPVAHEDHARRACHAAWHLTKAIGEYSDELRSEQGVELHVRLGLNSGEVVVGRVGDDVTLDPTALGHTVGLAQRMEAMAEPGTAYLTHHTARLVEGWFGLDDLGDKTVRGATAPLRVYALGGPMISPVRRMRSTRLVGRERELAVLDDALSMAIDGSGQVVGVVGEAGVGKSRLCDEFVRSVASRGYTIRRTAGVSHGKDVPLLPILALLREYFGVTEADRPGTAREKITSCIVALDPALEESLPLLFDFLEVPDPERPAPRVTPEIRMERLFTALRRITARRSEREVLVLLAEDLHWFDQQSEAFLERLIESFPGSRTLVVANFRPEFSATWMRHSYYRQLPVTPLPDVAVGELLGGLLGADFSLAPLLGFVQDRTGGNPFFVEEVVRALIEDGTLVGESGHYRLNRPLHTVNLPPSVQATLAARIDRLGESDKAVLQAASVIGRNFSVPVLVAACRIPDVGPVLSRLCAGEFVQEVGFEPVAEYRFWHPLTREVAYRGLLRDRRVTLHEAVAQAIIAADGDRLDERAALIAFHFEEAENHSEAARWYDRSAGFALRSDVSDAMRRWRTTLEHVASAPQTEAAAEIGIRAYNRLIRFGARTGMGLDEAAELYAEAKSLAGRLPDPAHLASVTFAYGSTLFFAGVLSEGSARYLEAADLADLSDDPDVRAGLSVLRIWIRQFFGPVTDGLAAADRTVALCGTNADVGATALGFSPLSLLGVMQGELLALRGQVNEARAVLEKSLAVARRRGEAEWIAWCLSGFARLARTPDEFSAALSYGYEALHTADESGYAMSRVIALGAIGVAHNGLARFGDAAETLGRAVAEARARNTARFEEVRLLVALAVAHLGADNREAARQVADEAVEVARRQGARVLECLALANRGRVRRATEDRADEAVADLGTALALARETEALSYEPGIREQLGRLRNDEFELAEAARLYRQVEAEGDALRLERELAARTAG
jgi:class 3 adenylate cyclase/tetratricopeptide (TPR) repeat protein